jgi:M6 family metalloprotease-like protein
MSLGFPSVAHRLKGPVIRALIMPVDFPDLIADSNPVSDYTEMTKGISDWYTKISNGTVKFEWVIYPRYIRMPRNVGDYKIGARTGTGWWDYSRVSIEAGDPFIDFSKYDLVVTGAPPKVQSDQISTSPAFGSPVGGGVKVDGVEIINATMTAEDTMRIQQGKPGWKGIAHEIGHLMGLVDLYDVASSMRPSGKPPTDQEQFAFMGGYGYMSHVHGDAPEMTAWERWVLNFLGDSQIRCVGISNIDSTHHITPVEFTDKNPRAVVIPISDTQRLVVESRRSIGYDVALKAGFEGALVYVIDVSKQTGFGPMKIIPKKGAKNAFLYDATLQAGDSVTYENYKVTNLVSDKNGDTIKVEKIGDYTPKPTPTPTPTVTPTPTPTKTSAPTWVDPLEGTPCLVENSSIPNQIFELKCLKYSTLHTGSANDNLYWFQNNPPPGSGPTPSPNPSTNLTPLPVEIRLRFRG